MSETPAHFPLLALPDPCLLAVLQCCAADEQRSLFSAARAHSRLHQAGVAALRSISAIVCHQQETNSVLLYLERHGSLVGSLKLRGLLGNPMMLLQLPPILQLHSLELQGWKLQLQPGDDFQGVLGAAAAAAAAGAPPLKQLRLEFCTLLDGADGLTAALLQLPALERLSLCANMVAGVPDYWLCLPTGVLQRLQQLTYLELGAVRLQGPDPASHDLQPLQALTRLADLRVILPIREVCITASTLSGMCHLTRLALRGAGFEPAALAGKAKLQHLELEGCTELQPASAGVAALLSQLQHQTQLTSLVLRYSMCAIEERSPPAAVYAALTASSKLQHLDITGCTLPAYVWQHMFSADRLLPHLTALHVRNVQPQRLPNGAAAAPEGSRIVVCCPGLQSLDIVALQYSTQQLNQLQGLSGLHTLCLTLGARGVPVGGVSVDTGETLQAVAQLTLLRKLGLCFRDAPTQLLVTQLQQLQQLPHLTVLEYSHGNLAARVVERLAPGNEPVWRQLLQRYLDDPNVAEAAAAALAQ